MSISSIEYIFSLLTLLSLSIILDISLLTSFLKLIISLSLFLYSVLSSLTKLFLSISIFKFSYFIELLLSLLIDILGINNLSFSALSIIFLIKLFNSSKLLNLISNLDGCIFTSNNLGSVSINNTHIGYLVSSL